MKRMNKVRALSVAIAISVAMVLLVWWTQGDRSHTSDDFNDLRVERKALPDEKNFRVVLDEAAGLLPGRVNAPQWLLTAKALGNKWEADAATNILAQSEEARARIKAGLNQCEGYSNGEPIKRTTGGYLGSMCDNADQRLALAWAMRVSFEHAVQTGDAERAYGLVCDMFRAASWVAESPGGLADLKHMTAWIGCGMMCCEKLSHQAACRDEWLAEMQERMPKRAEIVRAGTVALRSEFNRLYPFALRFSTWDKVYYPTCNELVFLKKRYWFFMDLTYRPAQTRRLLADAFRDAIAIVQRERVATPLEEKSAFKTKSVSDYFRPNIGGRIMNESVTFFNVLFVRRLKGLEAREECLRAVLACERYRRKAGAYPETLEALVPTFLDWVPHDPYSGGPLRYSRAKEIVWSAGANRNDDGGTTDMAEGRAGLFREESDSKALDLVYPVSSNQWANALETARRWHARGHARK